MKVIPVILAFLASPIMALAAEPEFDANVMVQAIIVSIPKAMAAELMAKPEIKNDAAATLEAVKKLVSDGKATYIANPSLKVISGNRATTQSLTNLDVEAIVGPDGVTVVVELALQYAAGNLHNKVTLKRGGTVFFGSTDSSNQATKPDEKQPAISIEPPPSTHLIFVHIQ